MFYLYLEYITDTLTDVHTNDDTTPGHSVGTINASHFGTTAAIYKNVRPADFGDLQHRFIDTSLLKKGSCNENRQTLPAKVSRLTPEESARKALVTAFSERESSRKQLNTNYTIPGALEFDDKAKTYNMRREQLATLMPGERLSIEDETLFPWLSTKGTVDPQVCKITSLSH